MSVYSAEAYLTHYVKQENQNARVGTSALCILIARTFTLMNMVESLRNCCVQMSHNLGFSFFRARYYLASHTAYCRSSFLSKYR